MKNQLLTAQRSATEAELQAADRIYHRWDEALGARSVDASLELYAADASLESALVTHLLSSQSGIVQGRDTLCDFIGQVYQHALPDRHRYRRGYFTDGQTLVWEYPRVTPDGQQIDLVEVMELRNGLIERHRVYWGWLGVRTLNSAPR